MIRAPALLARARLSAGSSPATSTWSRMRQARPQLRSLRAARARGSSLSVDRVQLPGVGNALQSVSAPIGELQPRPGHQVLDGPGDKQLLGFGLSADAGSDVDGDAAAVVSDRKSTP